MIHRPQGLRLPLDQFDIRVAEVDRLRLVGDNTRSDHRDAPGLAEDEAALARVRSGTGNFVTLR